MEGCPVKAPVKQQFLEKKLLEKHARRMIHKKMQSLYDKFRNDQFIKQATLYRQELNQISTDSFLSVN